MRILLAVLIVTLGTLVACDEGGATSPLPDADLSLPLCTGLTYDSCSANTQCTSMNCKLFDQDGIQVCTVACDASTPCPMTNGITATCNNRGICKPSGANACRVP